MQHSKIIDTFETYQPYLPIHGISMPFQVKFRVLPLNLQNYYYFIFVPLFLAHEEVLDSSVFTHARQALPLTCMHNVLVPNTAKRVGKRVPSPQKINNNKNK